MPPSKFDRWWWRAWYVFVALVLLWLAWYAWLARPPASWAQGWVGWWTGDEMASRPLWNFHLFLGAGNEIVPIDGNPAFRLGNTSFAELGHWVAGGEGGERWTWAGWVKVTAPDGDWPTNFLVIRSAAAPGFDLRLGFEAGHPRLFLFSWRPNAERTPDSGFDLPGAQAVALGQWLHLAVSADRDLQRVLINGKVVVEHRNEGHGLELITLADLRLTSYVTDKARAIGLPTHSLVEQDDVVLFDRVLPPEELAELALRGRGGWAPEVARPARAAQAWRRGWPLALLTLAGLIGLKLLPRVRAWLRAAAVVLVRPAYQAIRWTFAVGICLSVLLAGIVWEQGRRTDEQRFEEILNRFKHDTETEWAHLADLLMRAKDWIAVQTNLSQEAWGAWLQANRFPWDYPGSLGIGYALQVLPAQLARHEAEWSARHGFDYRVHPARLAPRQPVKELAGDPQLPVVLYAAPHVDRRFWFTNQTILGRDLLFQGLDDRRAWAEARRVEEVAARNEVQTSSLEEIAPAAWYGKPVQGLCLYVPWTLTNKIGDATTILESSAWRGVVFASVDVQRELSDRLGTSASPIGFRLYTGNSTGERTDRVLDSADFLPDTAERAHAYLRRSVEIRSYYRRLFLEAWTTETFEAQSMQRWAWWVGGAGGLFTLLATALLFVQVRAREEQSKVLEALRMANADLRLAQAERERMSRDLHDGSIQNLYGLGLHLQRVQSLLPVSPERAGAELSNSLEMLDQSIAELRQFLLTAGLDPLQPHNPASVLEGLVGRLRKTTPVEVQLQLDDRAAALTTSAGVQILNIVREAVSNALRHAAPKHIEIRLERYQPAGVVLPERWRLSVQDDGRGFDVQRMNGQGRGLKNLAARASELGGRSEIRSTPGNGTRIEVEFPVTH